MILEDDNLLEAREICEVTAKVKVSIRTLTPTPQAAIIGVERKCRQVIRVVRIGRYACAARIEHSVGDHSHAA